MSRVKKQLGVVVIALLLVGGLMAPASAAAELCPGENQNAPALPSGYTYLGKVQTGNLDGVVLAAGTIFCVKAGTGTTGIVTADGVKTLKQYAEAAGISSGVSHYTTYSFTTQPTVVTPGVQFRDPSCQDPTAGYTITDAANIDYSENVAPAPGTAIVVTATPKAPAVFDGAQSVPFSHTFGAVPTDCTPPPPPPPPPSPQPPVEPEVSANLSAEGICDIDVNLIDYLIEGENWSTGTLTVLVDGVVVATYPDVAPGNFGSLAWPLDADGQPYATISLSLEASGLVRTVGPIDLDEDCVVVLEDVVDEEPTDVIDEVEAEVEADGQDELPQTGIPALALTLLGLLSMGTGGALLRRRP
jgi:LPXTG-motif cell wall-anchored protein